MQSEIVEDNSIETNNIVKLIISVVLFFVAYYCLAYYPSVGDTFDYWHMSTAIITEKSAFIEQSSTNSGYYIFTVIIHTITNISYDIIPTLPFQSIPYIIILIIILRKISDMKSPSSYLVIFSLMLVIITKFGNKSEFAYWSHGLGFVLFLLIFYLAILRFDSKYENQAAISLLFIITILCLNYFSYKLVFFTLVFLISLQIVEWLFLIRSNLKVVRKSNFIQILLIGIVYFFSFNMMFYNEFLPRIRMQSETSSGIEKLLLSFTHSTLDPLDKYYFRYNTDVRNLYTGWLLLILISLFILTIYLLRKGYHNEKFNTPDKIMVSVIISSIAILFVYTILGLTVMSYLIFSGILGSALIYSIHKPTKDYKKLIVVIVTMLLCINLYVTIELSQQKFYNGIKDPNNYQYLKIPFMYINQKFTDGEKQEIVSDAFTGGYFAKEFANEGLSKKYRPSIFSRNHMLFLLAGEYNQYSKSEVFILNTKLHFFSANNWEMYNSWSKHKAILNANERLNRIYSSGDVEIMKSI